MALMKFSKKMQRFPGHTGIAFQIKGDLFDYLSKNIIENQLELTLKEQKMTLPLIHTLKNGK